MLYLGSLVGAYRFISNPGVVLLLVLGLPVGFVLLMLWRDRRAYSGQTP